MALDAVGEIDDALLSMFLFDFCRLMLVAVVTGVDDVACLVAGLAGQLAAVTMIEREGMADELGRLPGGGAVAAGTIEAEEASMHGRFLVAAGASARRAGKHPLLVTGSTGDGGMGAVQCEYNFMFEGGHCVETIVALGAGRSEEGVMFRHKGRVGVHVARCAVGGCRCVAAGNVAIPAGQDFAVIVVLVQHQAERGSIVVKCFGGDHRQGGTGAAVVRMAECTASGLKEVPVQTGPAISLAGNIVVALLAARRIDAAPGRVALLTIGLKLGVAGKLTLDNGNSSRPSRGSQPAGAEWQTATQPHHDRQRQRQKEGDGTAHSREERVGTLRHSRQSGKGDADRVSQPAGVSLLPGRAVISGGEQPLVSQQGAVNHWKANSGTDNYPDMCTDGYEEGYPGKIAARYCDAAGTVVQTAFRDLSCS